MGLNADEIDRLPQAGARVSLLPESNIKLASGLANLAAMPAALTLELATLGSPRAIGFTELVGRLQPGFTGDAVVLRPRAAHLMPLYDPAYAAKGGDVRSTSSRSWPRSGTWPRWCARARPGGGGASPGGP